MGLKDAVRMVELGGRTEQRRRCSLFNWQIRLLQTLSGGVTSRDKFAAPILVRRRPAGGPGGSGNTMAPGTEVTWAFRTPKHGPQARLKPGAGHSRLSFNFELLRPRFSVSTSKTGSKEHPLGVYSGLGEILDT